MTRIPATCIVDPLGAMQYEVVVTGALAYSDHVRTYTVKATSENDAAFQGLGLFVDEMEYLEDASK